jgi:hypothetical protein
MTKGSFEGSVARLVRWECVCLSWLADRRAAKLGGILKMRTWTEVMKPL